MSQDKIKNYLTKEDCLNFALEKSIKAVIKGSTSFSPVEGLPGGYQILFYDYKLTNKNQMQWALHEMRKVLMDRDCVEYNFITCNKYLFKFLKNDDTMLKIFAKESYFDNDVIAVMFGYKTIAGVLDDDYEVNFIRPEQCVSLRVVPC